MSSQQPPTMQGGWHACSCGGGGVPAHICFSILQQHSHCRTHSQRDPMTEAEVEDLVLKLNKIEVCVGSVLPYSSASCRAGQK